MNSFTTIETASSNVVPQIFDSIVSPIVTFVFLIYIYWRLVLATFIPLPFVLLVSYWC
ncbi:hypothetical protein H8356DRAFT_1275790 [Neocallimastix lanati (nom. inval.)]|uniref:ABC transmembrane type-1 domain-containing protein n=1 Tax=Neocallimastix californiae TaxID=1754190 RepID=A0A1Y2E1B8_9FUNG|nr:hypothetical protein H8356DRAFT_1275790 [Neocallimastix sp. JGI-2020a]ORY64655.1 hypothetical protein LY90DRAFT_641497 [Neocallimastix californiae]|eukprot:ORY64655.1 hypothetical protein LY90DRAFT_641497 [Neocallimastix californiae]